jgi:hypothetical protein
LGAGGTRLPTRLRGVGFFNAVLVCAADGTPFNAALVRTGEGTFFDATLVFSADEVFSVASFRALLLAFWARPWSVVDVAY